MTKTNTKNDKRIFPRGLLVLALVILTNPVVNIFDYLPDLFGYLIIAFSLTYFADRVPYFEEARVAFRNLAIVGGAKIPAYFIMTFVRGQNYSDNDIKALFAFSFSVIELALLLSAITKLFTALSYLGQRSDAGSLISAFPISKRRSATPYGLMKLCYFFVIYKAVFTALPEMLLLTRGVSAEEYGRVFNFARLYPYVILFSVVSIFVLGIILCKRFSKFLLAIYTEGKIYDGADGLYPGERREGLERKLLSKSLVFSLILFILASVFSFDLRFDNLSQIDILPDFLLGISAIVAIVRLAKIFGKNSFAFICALCFSAISGLSYVMDILFLTEHGYSALAMSKIAKSEYVPLMIVDTAELIAFVLMLISLICLIAKFIENQVGTDVHNKHYSKFDARIHASLRKQTYAWGVIGILCGVTKLLEVIFRYPSKVIYVATESGSATVSSSFAPWFGTVTSFCSILFIGFTVYLFTKLRDEVKLKYS